MCLLHREMWQQSVKVMVSRAGVAAFVAAVKSIKDNGK